MKTIILSLLLIIPSITFGQHISVEYEFKFNNNENPALGMISTHNVRLNDSVSISERVDQNTITKFDEVQKEEKGDIIKQKLTDNHYAFIPKNGVEYFKNYMTGSLISQDFIITKRVLVEDKLDMFTWNILDKDTVFLSTNCKIATTTHRGHTWTVFYSDKLGNKGGPWKLDGLPGLILHAKTEDNDFVFNAFKIEIKEGSINSSDPFLNEKTLTWEEYKKAFRDRMKRMVKRIDAKDENGEKSAVVKVGNSLEYLGLSEMKN